VEVDCDWRSQSGVSAPHIKAELEQLHNPIRLLLALPSGGTLPAPPIHLRKWEPEEIRAVAQLCDDSPVLSMKSNAEM